MYQRPPAEITDDCQPPSTLAGAAFQQQPATGPPQGPPPAPPPPQPARGGQAAGVAPFPLDVLPPMCRRFVEEVSRSVGVAEDIPAMALLAVAGGLAGRKCALELKPGWTQYPCLYVALVAESGSGKSPALDHVLAPAHLADVALDGEYQEARKTYQQQKLDLKAGKRDTEPQRPTPRQVLIEDFTGESLGPILRDNPNGVILALDELSGWVSAMNMYRGGRGRDRQLFLSIWSGQPYRIDRKGAQGQGQGQGPILVRTPFVAVVGCIPPSQVAKLRGHHEDSGDGLIERVLFVQPPQRPLPRRLFDPARQLSADSVLAWVRVAAWLLDSAGGVYRLSPEARTVFEECYQRQIADEVANNTAPPALRPQWSKLTNYAGRLALILHLLRCAEEGAFRPEIGADTVRAAWRLVEYLKSHLKAVHASPASHAADLTKAPRAAELKKAEVKKALQQWLSMKEPGQKVTVRGAYTNGWGLRDDHDLARQLMEEVAEDGRLTKNDDGSYQVV